jgi:hypothetical protein
MNAEIMVVSGLPRSGTSLMMQMLDQGGIEVVTDNIRTPDRDNPKGYYEYEIVKKIKTDKSWLPATRGKAFKMVSLLLFDLPADERYRIVFMERNLDEMLTSQDKMLERLGRTAAPSSEMKRSYTLHLERVRSWLSQQAHIQVCYVNYAHLMERPEEQARRVSEFLGGKADADRMAKTVDPALYRNRKGPTDSKGSA